MFNCVNKYLKSKYLNGFIFLYHIKQQSQHQSAIHTLFLYKTVYPFPMKLRVFFFSLLALKAACSTTVCHMPHAAMGPKKKKKNTKQKYMKFD